MTMFARIKNITTVFIILNCFCQFILTLDTKSQTKTKTENKNADQEFNWSYENQESWGFYYPECTGNTQSPIELDTSLVASTPFNSLRFTGYNRRFFQYVVDEGGEEDHTIRLRATFPHCQGPSLTGSVLSWVPYQLGAMQWHWGATRGVGSEHTFNNVQYDAELQLVHYNRKYGFLDVALLTPNFPNQYNHHKKQPSPVAILSVLFKEVDEPNEALQPLIDSIETYSRVLDRLRTGNGSYSTSFSSPLEVPISEPLLLDDLLPPNMSDLNPKVFSYKGSLSIPPCSEIVEHLVLADVNTIGTEQISVLRGLRDSSGLPLSNNFRRTQPLNGRQVSFF